MALFQKAPKPAPARDASIPSLEDFPVYVQARKTLTAASDRLREAEEANESFVQTSQSEIVRKRAEASLADGTLPADKPQEPPVSYSDLRALREAEKIARRRFEEAKHGTTNAIISEHREAWNREQCEILRDYLAVARRADRLLEKAQSWKLSHVKPPPLIRFRFSPAERDAVFELIGSGRLADGDSLIRYVFRQAKRDGLDVDDLDAEYNPK